MAEVSTKPYLMRAIYEWCIDHSYTPYLTVQVNPMARVPQEFVRDGRITFNISPTAAHGLLMDNYWVRFSARFGGIARQVEVPVDAVESLFSRENGQGLSFQIPDTAGDVTEETVTSQDAERMGLGAEPKQGARSSDQGNENGNENGSDTGNSNAKDTGDDHPPPAPGRPRLHVVK